MFKLVSIIVPVYNMENSIEKTIKSLLNQTYNNIEIILIDDGSTDNSFAICKQIEAFDSRVKCIHSVNQGSGPARNIGIKASQGDYLYFPDADDYIDSKAISTLVTAMSDGNFDLIVFGYSCMSHEEKLVFQKTYKEITIKGSTVRDSYQHFFGMLNEFSIQGAPWNKFFDGNTVRENNIEFPRLKRHQDEGFISRYMCVCTNIKFLPDILYTYYQNDAELEWKKFPDNYIESVMGLRDVWLETICRWNHDDHTTHKMVEREILSKTIKALELSFSPKMKLSMFNRLKWIRLTANKGNIAEYSFEIAGSRYQQLVLLFLQKEFFVGAASILYIGFKKKNRRINK